MFVLTRIGKANPTHSECPSITIEHSIQLARHSLGGSNVYSRSTPIGSLVIKPGKDTKNLYFCMGARGILSKVKVNNVALTDKEEKLLQPHDQIQFFGRKTNPLSLYVVSVSASANANAETPSKKRMRAEAFTAEPSNSQSIVVPPTNQLLKISCDDGGGGGVECGSEATLFDIRALILEEFDEDQLPEGVKAGDVDFFFEQAGCRMSTSQEKCKKVRDLLAEQKNIKLCPKPKRRKVFCGSSPMATANSGSTTNSNGNGNGNGNGGGSSSKIGRAHV